MASEVTTDITSDECVGHSLSQAKEDDAQSDKCETYSLLKEVAIDMMSAEYDGMLISQVR